MHRDIMLPRIKIFAEKKTMWLWKLLVLITEHGVRGSLFPNTDRCGHSSNCSGALGSNRATGPPPNSLMDSTVDMPHFENIIQLAFLIGHGGLPGQQTLYY